MTFYIYIIDKYFSPYSNSYMTLPGFTFDEVEQTLKSEGIFDNSIVLTGPEAKKFFTRLRNSDADTLDEYLEIYDSMKSSFAFEKYLAEGTAKISYSFWITGASDGHSSVYAVGADTVGAYEFNLSQIGKKLGSKYFYDYYTLSGKRMQHFSKLITLIALLSNNSIDTSNLTEEKLIQACQEGTYFVIQ